MTKHPKGGSWASSYGTRDPLRWIKVDKDQTWLQAYVKGIVRMLDTIHNGRLVHEKDNIKHSLQYCLSLIERGQDMSEWCKENLESLVVRAKKLYRENLALSGKDADDRVGEKGSRDR